MWKDLLGTIDFSLALRGVRDWLRLETPDRSPGDPRVTAFEYLRTQASIDPEAADDLAYRYVRMEPPGAAQALESLAEEARGQIRPELARHLEAAAAWYRTRPLKP